MDSVQLGKVLEEIAEELAVANEERTKTRGVLRDIAEELSRVVRELNVISYGLEVR